MAEQRKLRRSRLHSNDPSDAEWRSQQAHVDADIEGLSRDTEADRLVAEMDVQGVLVEQQIERLKSYFVVHKVSKPAVS